MTPMGKLTITTPMPGKKAADSRESTTGSLSKGKAYLIQNHKEPGKVEPKRKMGDK